MNRYNADVLNLKFSCNLDGIQMEMISRSNLDAIQINSLRVRSTDQTHRLTDKEIDNQVQARCTYNAIQMHLRRNFDYTQIKYRCHLDALQMKFRFDSDAI